jgi:hypothetical protein
MNIWPASFYNVDTCIVPLGSQQEGCVAVYQNVSDAVVRAEQLVLLEEQDPSEDLILYRQEKITNNPTLKNRVRLQCSENTVMPDMSAMFFREQSPLTPFPKQMIYWYRHLPHPGMATVLMAHYLLNFIRELQARRIQLIRPSLDRVVFDPQHDKVKYEAYEVGFGHPLVREPSGLIGGMVDYYIKKADIVQWLLACLETSCRYVLVYKTTTTALHKDAEFMALMRYICPMPGDKEDKWNLERLSAKVAPLVPAALAAAAKASAGLEEISNSSNSNSSSSSVMDLDTDVDTSKSKEHQRRKSCSRSQKRKRSLSLSFYKAHGKPEATISSVAARLQDLLFSILTTGPNQSFPSFKITDTLERDYMQVIALTAADVPIEVLELYYSGLFTVLRNYGEHLRDDTSYQEYLEAVRGILVRHDVFNRDSSKYMMDYVLEKTRLQQAAVYPWEVEKMSRASLKELYSIDQEGRLPENKPISILLRIFDQLFWRLDLSPLLLNFGATNASDASDDGKIDMDSLDVHTRPTLETMKRWGGPDDSYFIKKYFSKGQMDTTTLGFPFPKALLEHSFLIHATTLGGLRQMLLDPSGPRVADQLHRPPTAGTGFTGVNWESPIALFYDPRKVYPISSYSDNENAPSRESVGVYMYMAPKSDVDLEQFRDQFESLQAEFGDALLFPIVFDWSVLRDFNWHFSVGDRYGGISLAAEIADPTSLPGTKVSNQLLLLMKAVYTKNIGVAKLGQVDYMKFGELVLYASEIPFSKYVPSWYMNFMISLLQTRTEPEQ